MRRIIIFVFVYSFSLTTLHFDRQEYISYRNLFAQNKADDKITLNLYEKKISRNYFKTNRSILSDSLTKKINTRTTKEKQYKINPLKMTLLGVSLAGVFTGMHIYYSNTWWKDQRNFFKFAEDGYYARNMDKFSHIYTANAFTELTAVCYEWTGVSPGKALLYGAITSMAYETYIEINDGFAPNWGFDWTDMGANFLGAIYPFIQKEVTPFQHINFKWSVKPGWFKKKVGGDDLLDDYTNMTFWLSINPELFFPKSLTKRKFYPNFLAIAVGMSIKNASHKFGSLNAEAEWFISLDYDLRKLPGNSEFMKKLKRILNFYHFPAPAVRVTPSGIWYGLYF